VVDVWIHQVDEDASGLTFEEWDPSSDTDTSQTPVAMIVNSSELSSCGFDVREVIPLQLESVTCGDWSISIFGSLTISLDIPRYL
jgi:hypothetical protein